MDMGEFFKGALNLCGTVLKAVAESNPDPRRERAQTVNSLKERRHQLNEEINELRNAIENDDLSEDEIEEYEREIRKKERERNQIQNQLYDMHN